MDFCVFAENHAASKTAVAKALYGILENLSFDDIIRIDAAMRETARHFITWQTTCFDYRGFYHNNLGTNTVAAIYGLSEIGVAEDVASLEQYMHSSQIATVKAAMTALMRLNSKKFSSAITELLDDIRAGVVKTAHNLIIKYRSADFFRIKEIFNATKYEHTKVKTSPYC